jgi:phospholipid/cholesterol/gamma-HCH transport system ATP-binding protein
MLEIKELYKSFGSKKILNGVSLEVNDQEIVSIIGMSGTGKSVLLKNIIGLLEADAGQILLDNNDITNYSEQEYNQFVRPKMSMVFQEGALWDSMTVGQNIDLALKIQKHLTEEERSRRISESLEMVGLPPIQDLYPEELSGGMIKRVAIARAIATRPKYLLYDEPTTGLDPVLSNMINDLIVKLNSQLGTTSLVISHDISGVEKISNRIAMLYKGKIVHICAANVLWEQEHEIFNQFIHGKVNFK